MMPEEENTIQIVDSSPMTIWRQHHRFIIMITAAILISFVFVGISIGLYNSSGAAQLDLSRPGYSSVRQQTKPDKAFVAFPSSGSIAEDTIEDFRVIYEKKATEATAVDAFSGDVLSDVQLGIDAPDESGL